MTNDDAALLTRATAQLRTARKANAKLDKEAESLREENTKLRIRVADLRAALKRAEAERKTLAARLAQPDALDVELYKSRAEAWEEEARVLRLANKSFE